ncbi:AI-2E family transporter [Aquimarina sp. ERC-38]|uniref:AI-2E family transporter n=1 Tax=Aquimarina sp. ERC-38 TaxID=2949996 RepID=UPI0022473655|nr:AI-2E family transporter [Aquimarina sp. ERC-38]UZO80855.1 AI-2E family transporter [Aquimarina sp. ERC-38]
MNTQNSALSFLVKLLIVIAVVVILYFGAQLLIPLIYAVMLALLILPLVNRLIKIGLPESLSIGIASVSLLAVFIGIIALIIWQGAEMGENTAQFEKKFDSLYEKTQNKVNTYLGVTPKEQDKEVDHALEQVPKKAFDFISGATMVLSDWLLAFVYIIVLLLERKRMKQVVLKIIDDRHKTKALHSMTEISATVKDYLYGQFLVTVVLAVVYAIGFSILGIKFSIILAIIAALLTFIPYLGNIVGGLMIVAMGFMSGLAFNEVIYIVIFLSLVQLIESYILKPWIIGNEISLNIFTVIFSIVAFSMLWGIAGSIIALPLTSILRICFSKIENLQPYAYLLSDNKKE